MRKKKVSVAMAVCNGGKYIKQQIDSILIQLEDHDELIISYDSSQDKTLDIIMEYQKKDSRVYVYINKKFDRGLVSNFDNALQHCTGDFIFYSDQDDYWMSDKIQKMVDYFEDPKITVVVHDAQLSDNTLKVYEWSTFALRGGSRAGFWGNFFRLSYIGCCMAFRGELLPVVLPLPTKKRSHDWWTGCICSCYGKMEVIRESLIIHRIHDENATPKKRPGLCYQIAVRCIILFNSMKRMMKFRKSDFSYIDE